MNEERWWPYLKARLWKFFLIAFKIVVPAGTALVVASTDHWITPREAGVISILFVLGILWTIPDFRFLRRN